MEKGSVLKSKIRGCLVGSAVGDALGMPVETLTHYQIRRKYGEINEMVDGRLPAGSYTDDTQQMIALAESLIDKKGIDQNDIAEKFVRIYQSYRGYGEVRKQQFHLMKLGWRWEEAVQKVSDLFSYWNGAAMRIAPIGAFYYDDIEKLKWAAYKSSEVTHLHELAKEGCALQALAISLAMQTKPSSRFDLKAFLNRLERFVSHNIYKTKLKNIEILLSRKSDISQETVINLLGNGMEAFNCVPTAIYCFLRYLDSFEKAVTYAVNLGGDADSLGAMTGAISGAYHGIQAIPAKWTNKLEDMNYIQSLADKLWMLKKKKK